MEALRRIPLTIDKVSDINQIETGLNEIREYKDKVNKFITLVQKQFGAFASKYQTEINHLKNQIQALRQQNLALKNQPNLNNDNFKHQNFDCLSPIKRKKQSVYTNQLEQHKYSESSFINPQKGTASTFKYTKSKEKQFPFEIMDHQQSPKYLNKSRFETQSNKKKIRVQQIMQSLQSGQKNFEVNTEKLFRVLGKSKQPEIVQNQQAFQQNKSSKDKDQQLNASLGAICQTLNNSFISRKSRSKLKKNIVDQEEIKKKKQMEEQRVKRQRGVKSLLKGLRDYANSSSEKQVETIKTSKLLNTGQDNIKLQGKTSKVMINPIPVRTQQRSISRSPQMKKRSQSILKKNSILSKSIQGISAISFHQN